ncbi:MAG: hypothetical protein JW867_00270 [Candidatus Omnitrophica bacterium]|nr:hypothetical protein [Candidatus Omnitrophota bacterium]
MPDENKRKTDPRFFFKTVYQKFQQAEKSTSHLSKCFFRIGDSTICFRFAGSGLKPQMLPAIEHMMVPANAQADLTICAFDTDTTKINIPDPPWSSTLERGTLPGYSDKRISTAFFIDSCILAMLNMDKHLAVYWIKNSKNLPYNERCFPARALLHWWFRHNKKQIAHAAAVGTPEGGILLAGKRGSGKSTTALSCLNTDLMYAGDDYILLSLNNPPRVYSLSSSAKLNPDSLKKLSLSMPRLGVREKINNKSIVFVNSHYPEKIISSFPLKAVFIPAITTREKTKLIEISPAKALLSIAPSTVIPLPGTDSRDFDYLGDLVSKVPNYIIELSNNAEEIADCIKVFLSKH